MSVPYLLASLPHLLFDAPAPITAEAFAEACRGQLSENDAATAEALLQTACSSVVPLSRQTPFLAAWFEKETLIRNAVARCRNTRRGRDPELATRFASTADVRVTHAVEAAFQLGDPEARDTALERLRWSVAEELQGTDPMALGAVFGYAAKLRVSLRRAAMTQEAGGAVAEQLFNAPLPGVEDE